MIYGGTILAGFVLLSSATRAATLFLAPSSGTYNVGSNFSIAVKVNTAGVPINAAEGIIVFNPNELAVTSLSKSGSVFNLWVQEPDFSNALGTINFGGIIFNPGYTGASGTLLTLNLKAKAVGSTQLVFSSGAVLANDGLGTNVLSAMSGGSYSLKTSSAVPQTAPEAPAVPSAPSSIPLPVIKSLTHPDQTKWYNNGNPEFSWTLPEGIDNTSYLLNQKPDSNPGSIPDGLKNSVNFTNTDDGIWFFHAKFRKSGKWGPIAHYKFQIDTVPPPILEITRDIDQNDPANPQVVIVFKSTDNLSGVDFYEMKIGERDWLRLDRSLEGQPYKLPLAQILGFNNIGIKTTDFAGNSVITEFDVNLIEKILVKAPVKQGELLELRGKAKPNKKLIISVLIAEAAKQILGAQIGFSLLAKNPGNYIKEIEKTVDENGDWQVELSDLPSIKYILAISLQDYSVIYSKTPAETTVSTNWFQEILKKILKLFDYLVRGVSQGALLMGFIVILAGLLISLFKIFKVGAGKWWHKIRQQRALAITENKSSKKLLHLIDDIEEEILFLKSIDRRRRLGPEEKYLKTKLEQYLKTLKMFKGKD